MNWGANATGTSTFLSYFHTFISGSYAVHIPGGSTTVQLEVSPVGTLHTDNDDSLSWTLVVHKD
jgi:hypothetical protein